MELLTQNSLLQILDQAAIGSSLFINSDKKIIHLIYQDGAISSLYGQPLKSLD